MLFVLATWIILAFVFWPFIKAIEKNDLKQAALSELDNEEPEEIEGFD